MPDFSESFDALTDPDMWIDVATVGAGYMGASVAQTTIDGMTSFDVPNEVYGAGVVAVGYGMDFPQSGKVATGGALYTVDSLAQRAELKQEVTAIAQEQGGN